MSEPRTDSKLIRVALLGNPNTGKTTLFNKLCGLRQKTGNYPGVTVDKKRGYLKVDGNNVEVIDLPGINSVYPGSKDEELVVKYLLGPGKIVADVVVVVLSAINLKRNLYLLEQLKDLELPIVAVVNMIDLAKKRGILIDKHKLESTLGVPVFLVSSKKDDGIRELKSAFLNPVSRTSVGNHFIEEDKLGLLTKFASVNKSQRVYENFLNLTQPLSNDGKFAHKRQAFITEEGVDIRQLKKNEAILRYKWINAYLPQCVTERKDLATDLTSRLDRVLIHPVYGYMIFLFIMFFLFQAIFWLASYPMDWIDAGFASLAGYVEGALPTGYFTDLVTQGIIPGVGGVVIFIPQIAILFLLFSILEESGYMARIVYLSDRMMQYFGMSGKSVIPLISGMACAVPAIMSARTIENSRDRLITILVTPLLTCSARIPVYVIIIGLVVPDRELGIFNLQGIALMGMYLLGIITALIAGFCFKLILRSEYKSFLLMELPEYLPPDIKNVMVSVWTNSKAFVWNAGKIILATSIILFVLATSGGEKFDNAEEIVHEENSKLSDEQYKAELTAFKLENSYLGVMGRVIEPVIKPIGYDWKIGIAVLSSLAAREVFVGTISTIYAIDSDEEMTIRNRLKTEVNARTHKAAFGLATCISLLIFYAFSLQCLSTVAVTYKETGSLKWTAIQFLYMSVLAYIAAFIAYQLLK